MRGGRRLQTRAGREGGNCSAGRGVDGEEGKKEKEGKTRLRAGVDSLPGMVAYRDLAESCIRHLPFCNSRDPQREAVWPLPASHPLSPLDTCNACYQQQ